jgi:hypothetical protein
MINIYGDFHKFYAKILAFFLKTNDMIFLRKNTVLLLKIANYFFTIFSAKIFLKS